MSTTVRGVLVLLRQSARNIQGRMKSLQLMYIDNINCLVVGLVFLFVKGKISSNK